MNKEEFVSEMIFACTNNNPESFLPFILKVEVETDFTNKLHFYNFFKGMLDNAHQTSKGKLRLKVETPDWNTDKELINYSFYDGVHIHPLLTLTLKENKSKLNLGIDPF